MTRTVYYTATSLDGFIATPEHSLDWLLSRDIDAHGPMGYDGFIAGVGALAMGATTYLWVRDHDPGWMPERPGLGLHAPRAASRWRGRTCSSPLRTRRGCTPPWWRPRGSGTSGSWAAATWPGSSPSRGLLDEVVVNVAPVTLGGGAPLLPRRLELAVAEVARNGEFVCVRYTVVRRRPDEPADRPDRPRAVTWPTSGMPTLPAEVRPDRAARPPEQSPATPGAARRYCGVGN